MRKITGTLLALLLLCMCTTLCVTKVNAVEKNVKSKAIAIVFDNSGTMYSGGNTAWCQATYAMEVFASMLNEGDKFYIYPMCTIDVNGNEYTKENPLCISDASESSLIREIYTINPSGTPIESIDCAVKGIREVNADEKYVIVLTDGDVFYENGVKLDTEKNSRVNTVKALDKRIEEYAGGNLTMMYLGIGNGASEPTIKESDVFVKRRADDRSPILSTLTGMCNKIFGRDTLPQNHIKDNTISFDISLSKMIVFIQGENISNVDVKSASGKSLTCTRKTTTKYSEKGCGAYESFEYDESLQGMMLTYEDCLAGDYVISYSGKATSMEIYYEPDADLAFIFTDSDGNIVDPDKLYEGDYIISFGMLDARTGELISSDLLGTPSYKGAYYIDGNDFSIEHDGHSGQVKVPLKMDESFKANLKVTFLKDYEISKNETDFGWPEGGIIIAPRPAGFLKLDITGGEDVYSLQDLERGKPYIATIYYNGEKLTGKELERVELEWQPETSNAEIRQEFSEDYYNLWLSHKDPANPVDTVCGKCTVNIYATYAEEGGESTQVKKALTYMIKDDAVAPKMKVHVPQGYMTIKELENSSPLVVNFSMKGNNLSKEDFANVKLAVDCGGVKSTVTANADNSSYLIKLLPTEGVKEGKYNIKINAEYTDHIGRVTPFDDEVTIELGKIPLWMKWLIGILILLLILIIALIIMHIRVLPKHAHVVRNGSQMIFDGEDVTNSTSFDGEIDRGQLRVGISYAGVKSGLSMDVKPGKQSYLKRIQTKRYAEVNPNSVKRKGSATILEATLGSVKYEIDSETEKFVRSPKNDKPFDLRHGSAIRYSGTITLNGEEKPFAVTTKLNCKKKKR